MTNRFCFRGLGWSLLFLSLFSCSDSGIISDCPFHRYSFTLDVEHDYRGGRLFRGDSIVFNITFADLLPDETTGEMINVEKVPFKAAMAIREYKSSGLLRGSYAKDAFDIEVLTGDSLIFDPYYYNYFTLAEEGAVIIGPERSGGLNRVQVKVKGLKPGSYIIYWKAPFPEVELYQRDLIYDEGCYERVDLKFRNAGLHNFPEPQPGSTEEIWINESGLIRVSVDF